MKESHTMDILFVICLFFVFTLSAITVVMIGSHVYSKTVDTMDTMHNNETAMNYLVEKVRLHNDGHIKVLKQKDYTVLCLKEEDSTNYIYTKNHYLYEYTSKKAFNPKQGQKLLAVDSLSLKVSKSLLTITLTINNKTQTSYVALVGRDAA